MVDYDRISRTWSVEWLEGTTKERQTQNKLPRIHIYFKADDPFNFADRMADAHSRREVQFLYLRHVFVVVNGDPLSWLCLRLSCSFLHLIGESGSGVCDANPHAPRAFPAGGACF